MRDRFRETDEISRGRKDSPDGKKIWRYGLRGGACSHGQSGKIDPEQLAEVWRRYDRQRMEFIDILGLVHAAEEDGAGNIGLIMVLLHPHAESRGLDSFRIDQCLGNRDKFRVTIAIS